MASTALQPRPILRVRAAALSGAWAAAGGVMLYWHIGMLDGPGPGRRDALSSADALTYARMLAAPAVYSASRSRSGFLVLLAAGAVTDAVDGPLARRRGSTRLGRDLDASADVAFFTSAALSAARAGWLARPAASAIALRELGLLLGTAAFYFAGTTPPPRAALGATRFAGPLTALGLALAATGKKTAGSAVVLATTAAAAATHLAIAAGRPAEPGGSGQPGD